MPATYREIFKEEWAKLPDDDYEITIKRARRGYTTTRYKYYFDCVLYEILIQAGRYYRITNPATGEIRMPNNAIEMHEIMKAIYNPVTVQVGRVSLVLPGSTTDLSDRDFIGNYLEQIISEHSGPPYLCEIPMYEDWKEMRKAGKYKVDVQAANVQHP